MNSDDILSGKRVLVVEDEALVAMLVESMLEDLGCIVAASAATCDEALKAIAVGGIDGAVLDVNLGHERSTRVADALEERKIPFVFATGYGMAGLEPYLRTRTVLQKPFRAMDLRKALGGAMSGLWKP